MFQSHPQLPKFFFNSFIIIFNISKVYCWWIKFSLYNCWSIFTMQKGTISWCLSSDQEWQLSNRLSAKMRVLGSEETSLSPLMSKLNLMKCLKHPKDRYTHFQSTQEPSVPEAQFHTKAEHLPFRWFSIWTGRQDLFQSTIADSGVPSMKIVKCWYRLRCDWLRAQEQT